jgi:hypothetical protein
VKAPYGYGLAQALDVNLLNAPCGDIIEIPSSSYELSISSSKASSSHRVGAGAAPKDLSSVSIGDL